MFGCTCEHYLTRSAQPLPIPALFPSPAQFLHTQLVAFYSKLRANLFSMHSLRLFVSFYAQFQFMRFWPETLHVHRESFCPCVPASLPQPRFPVAFLDPVDPVVACSAVADNCSLIELLPQCQALPVTSWWLAANCRRIFHMDNPWIIHLPYIHTIHI